jgi:starvation-inducible DNA-binding protein
MLQDTLRSLLADTYIVYFKAHSYHWNVEGPDFAQYHAFLGEYYNDVYGSIDAIAELIRTLDVYAPVSFASLLSQSTIDESNSIPEAKAMLTQLLRDNDVLLARLVKSYDEAEQASEFGISNFLQDRIQAHEKHSWMLRAITK